MRTFLHARRARAHAVTIREATRASAFDDDRIAFDSTRFDAKKFFWITSLNRVVDDRFRSESSESPDNRFARASRRATVATLDAHQNARRSVGMASRQRALSSYA
jgi:hypothetical protein